MPTIVTDKRGVWVDLDGGPARRIGIRWSEIFSLSGGKVDCITHTPVVLNLDFDFGEYIELWEGTGGYTEALGALTKRLRGIDPKWHDILSKLTPNDEPVTFWRRPDHPDYIKPRT